MKSFIDSSLLQTDGIISNKYASKCMPRLLFKGVGEEEICAYISKELCLEMCPNSSLHLSKNTGILRPFPTFTSSELLTYLTDFLLGTSGKDK